MTIEDKEYYISSIIRLVADENINNICKVAKNIKKHKIDVDNRTIYEAYCNCNDGDDTDAD